jgi:hypothetical protein
VVTERALATEGARTIAALANDAAQVKTAMPRPICIFIVITSFLGARREAMRHRPGIIAGAICDYKNPSAFSRYERIRTEAIIRLSRRPRGL